jgi:DtxR family Mn-dependent transcriptional regulator
MAKTAPPYPVAVEDYVKAIYAHTEWQPVPITSSVLAARLGLAASSVTEMVKKLGAQGLVDHQPYGAVTLTAEGTRLALRMVRRHRLIETWLVREFGYLWDEVHDEAEVLEHALSDRMLDAIDDRLARPRRDPHGDPIPSRDGTVARPAATLLRDVAAGETVTVARISDRDPGLLRHLEAAGVRLDAALTVGSLHPLVLVLAGRPEPVALGQDALESIWVSRAGRRRVK